MKMKAIVAALALAAAGSAEAAWFYGVTLASETALAHNKNYVLDVNKLPTDTAVNRLSAQAVYAISGSTSDYTGDVGMAWSASNDGVNYGSLAVSSATYLASASTTTATSTLWDFGAFDYRYLKLSVVGPTAGTMSLVVTVNGKH